jgi:hypothetical protein
LRDLRPALGKTQRCYLKKKKEKKPQKTLKQKRYGDVAQVVEQLPSKHEAMFKS